jgi:hypothetical protein
LARVWIIVELIESLMLLGGGGEGEGGGRGRERREEREKGESTRTRMKFILYILTMAGVSMF